MTAAPDSDTSRGVALPRTRFRRPKTEPALVVSVLWPTAQRLATRDKSYNALAKASIAVFSGQRFAISDKSSTLATLTPGRPTALETRRMSIWSAKASTTPSPQPNGSTSSTRRSTTSTPRCKQSEFGWTT